MAVTGRRLIEARRGHIAKNGEDKERASDTKRAIYAAKAASRIECLHTVLLLSITVHTLTAHTFEQQTNCALFCNFVSCGTSLTRSAALSRIMQM